MKLEKFIVKMISVSFDSAVNANHATVTYTTWSMLATPVDGRESARSLILHLTKISGDVDLADELTHYVSYKALIKIAEDARLACAAALLNRTKNRIANLYSHRHSEHEDKFSADELFKDLGFNP